MALIGISMADLFTGQRLGRHGGARASRAHRRPVEPVTRSITINRSPEEIYRFWRDLQNLPRFMDHLASVEVIDAHRSRWNVKGPGARIISLDVELTDDRPGEHLAWRTRTGAEIAASGAVRFVRAPGERGTEVHLQMGYEAPAGLLGRALARLVGGVIKPHLASDLHRLEQLLETGEIARSDASVHGGPHPAQPPEEPPQPGASLGRLDGSTPRPREISASREGGAP
jgi:uncharacterized membrane protein